MDTNNLNDIAIRRLNDIVRAADALLDELPEEIAERSEHAVNLQHLISGLASDTLANLDELVQLFTQSAAIYAGGEENADVNEMMDISERSVALAEKMGITEVNA